MLYPAELRAPGEVGRKYRPASAVKAGTARQVSVFGEPFAVGPDELIPFTIQQVESFKIVAGKISRVEVTLGPRVPCGMRSPFDMATLWKER